MVAAVEGIAVGRDGLRLERLVRPADRHFGGNRPDEILPQRQLHHGPGALVGQQKALTVLIGGRHGGAVRGGFRSCSARQGSRRSPLGRAEYCQCQPVTGDRQECTQHQQQGAEEKECLFHRDFPSRTGIFLGIVYQPGGVKKRTFHPRLEFTSQKRYHKGVPSWWMAGKYIREK